MNNLIARAKRATVLVEDATDQTRSDELATAVTRVLEAINETLKVSANAKSIDAFTGVDSVPAAANKKLRSSARRLRQELDRQGTAALQRKEADTLEAACRDYAKGRSKATKSAWARLFSDLDELNRRIQSIAGVSRLQLASRLQQLKALSVQDPIEEIAFLVDRLGDDSSTYRSQINRQIQELETAITDATDRQQSKTSDAVRTLLSSAHSNEGFPLEDLTLELLEDLRVSGHIDDLVIRSG